MPCQVKTKLWVGNRCRFRCPVGKGKERTKRRPICPLRSVHPSRVGTFRRRRRRRRKRALCVPGGVSGEFCPAYSSGWAAIDRQSESVIRAAFMVGLVGRMTILGRPLALVRLSRSFFTWGKNCKRETTCATLSQVVVSFFFVGSLPSSLFVCALQSRESLVPIHPSALRFCENKREGKI